MVSRLSPARSWAVTTGLRQTEATTPRGCPHVMATSRVSFGNIITCELNQVVPPKLLIEGSPARKRGRSATKRYRGNGCATRQSALTVHTRFACCSEVPTESVPIAS
jgi:hypothetical protein